LNSVDSLVEKIFTNCCNKENT